MPRVPVIEERNLVDEVLELRKRHSTREIADLLRKRHNVKVSHVAVGKWLRSFDEKREEVTQEAMRGAAAAEAETRRYAAEEAKARLPTDLKALDGVRDTMYELCTGTKLQDGMEGKAADEVKDRIAAGRAVAAAVKVRFDVTGGKPLDEGKAKELMGNLAELVGKQLRDHHDPHATSRSERTKNE
jgi:transposase